MNVKAVASDSRSLSYQGKMTVKWHVPDAAHGMPKKVISLFSVGSEPSASSYANLQALPEGCGEIGYLLL